ncbi:MAG: DUF3343 domain-containing protein [Bacillota bacterium]|jgi:hypothetical protein
MQVLIVFDSTHYALQAEQALQSAGMSLDTIPTPREITASCGLSVSLPEQQLPAALQIMRSHGVVFRAIYNLMLRDGKKHYLLREED